MTTDNADSSIKLLCLCNQSCRLIGRRRPTVLKVLLGTPKSRYYASQVYVCVCVCVCACACVCVCVCVVCIESWNMYIWLMTTRLGPVQVRRSKYPLLFWVFIIINLRPLVLSLGRSVMLCQKGWFKVSCVLWAADPCLPDSSRWLCVGPPHNRRSPC